MNSIIRLVAVVAGLVLLLNVTPSWGQLVNTTVSDANGNTAGGTNALQNVVFPGACGTVGGCGNTAFGAHAIQADTTGNFNTAIGADALPVTTGNDNTASGAGALADSTTGNANTANGSGALASNTSGSLNTAVGSGALASNTTGKKNIAVGVFALASSTGSQNIGIGYNAGGVLGSGNNNIYLGHPGVSSESLTIRLGNVQTSTFIAGIATASVSGAAVEVDTATGQLGVLTSSARYKRDIVAMGTRSEGVLQLRPVTFVYKDDSKGVTHYGLIAEEVAAVYPELVTHTAAGEVQAVRYQELIPMLLNELQRQRQEFQQTLQSQQQALQTQAQTLQRQQQELAELRRLLVQGRDMALLSQSGELAQTH